MKMVVDWAIRPPGDLDSMWCYDKDKKKVEEHARWFRKVFRNKDFQVLRVTHHIEEKGE